VPNYDKKTYFDFYIMDANDTIILGTAFGSRPGDANRDPGPDINIDNAVKFADATIIGNNFGKEDSYSLMLHSY